MMRSPAAVAAFAGLVVAETTMVGAAGSDASTEANTLMLGTNNLNCWNEAVFPNVEGAWPATDRELGVSVYITGGATKADQEIKHQGTCGSDAAGVESTGKDVGSYWSNFLKVNDEQSGVNENLEPVTQNGDAQWHARGSSNACMFTGAVDVTNEDGTALPYLTANADLTFEDMEKFVEDGTCVKKGMSGTDEEGQLLWCKLPKSMQCKIITQEPTEVTTTTSCAPEDDEDSTETEDDPTVIPTAVPGSAAAAGLAAVAALFMA